MISRTRFNMNGSTKRARIGQDDPNATDPNLDPTQPPVGDPTSTNSGFDTSGMTDNGDGTYTATDGTVYDAIGNVIATAGENANQAGTSTPCDTSKWTDNGDETFTDPSTGTIYDANCQVLVQGTSTASTSSGSGGNAFSPSGGASSSAGGNKPSSSGGGSSPSAPASSSSGDSLLTKLQKMLNNVPSTSASAQSAYNSIPGTGTKNTKLPPSANQTASSNTLLYLGLAAAGGLLLMNSRKK